MSRVKQTVYNVLKGRFLVNENAQKNWGFLLFLTLLALFVIASSHQMDQKVRKIAQYNKEMRELRAQFVATRSDLMKLKMESSITKRLAENGLFASKTPPQKIIVRIQD